MKKKLIVVVFTGTILTSTIAPSISNANEVQQTQHEYDENNLNQYQVYTPPLISPFVVVGEGHGTGSTPSSSTIWSSPNDAKKIGYTFTLTKTIFRQELLDISNYIDNQEAGRSIQLGIATSIITIPARPIIAIPAGTGVAMLLTYVNTQGKIVSNTLKQSTKTSFKVTINYRYRQVGPNDGYYFIDSISIN